MKNNFDDFLDDVKKDIENGSIHKVEPTIILESKDSFYQKEPEEIIDESLKLFEVFCDTIFITLYAKDLDDAKKLLLEYDDCFIFKPNNECYYNFGNSTKVEVEISEVKKTRKILHWESH